MSNAYLDLPALIKNAFGDIENDIIMDLRANNKEYATIHAKMREIKQQHPIIDKVMHESVEIHLTEEEHTALTKYMHLLFKLEDIERLQLYFRGHTDAFAYLKKINAI